VRNLAYLKEPQMAKKEKGKKEAKKEKGKDKKDKFEMFKKK
jgi:hypothetical protein